MCTVSRHHVRTERMQYMHKHAHKHKTSERTREMISGQSCTIPRPRGGQLGPTAPDRHTHTHTHTHIYIPGNIESDRIIAIAPFSNCSTYRMRVIIRMYLHNRCCCENDADTRQSYAHTTTSPCHRKRRPHTIPLPLFSLPPHTVLLELLSLSHTHTHSLSQLSSTHTHTHTHSRSKHTREHARYSLTLTTPFLSSSPQQCECALAKNPGYSLVKLGFPKVDSGKMAIE